MAILYMLLNLTAHQGEVMLVRRYGRKYGNGGLLFNGVICLFAMIFFLLSDRDGIHFVPGIWRYGLINALLYATGFYFAYVAHSTGNYFLTQTITTMSFIIPIVFGLFLLKEPANTLTYSSLFFSVSSVLLMCYARLRNAKQSASSGEISAKWLISVLIVLLSNGFISVVAKLQRNRFGGLHSNEYMVITLTGAFLSLLIMSFLLERKDMRKGFLRGSIYGMGAGLLNGMKNAANLSLIAQLPLSVLTPVQKGAGMIFTYIVSVFLYKEKYTKLQYLSMSLSVIAIVLMQLS